MSLGLNYTPKWANCFITSGETPIVNETDGAGALNRVIEIECKANDMVIRDGHRTANAVKANYGYAGRLFIDKLCEDGQIDRAKQMYEKNYSACTRTDTTEKQAMAAAIILTADQLATEWIFKDGHELTVSELGEFMKSKASVSLSERGYEIMCDWVAENSSQFQPVVEHGEHYGVIEDDVAIINRSVFNRVCQDNSISPKALLSSLKVQGKLVLGAKGYDKTKKIDNIPVHCIWMRMQQEDEEIDEEQPL